MPTMIDEKPKKRRHGTDSDHSTRAQPRHDEPARDGSSSGADPSKISPFRLLGSRSPRIWGSRQTKDALDPPLRQDSIASTLLLTSAPRALALFQADETYGFERGQKTPEIRNLYYYEMYTMKRIYSSLVTFYLGELEDRWYVRPIVRESIQSSKISKVDKEILKVLLQPDGNISSRALAGKLGVPVTTLQRRRNHLESKYLDITYS